MIYVPDSVAWTEAPELLRVLSRQRSRWHCGLSDTLWRHRRVLFNPRYGAMGLVGYPYFFFVEFLAPMVEAMGLVGVVAGLLLGALNVPLCSLFFLVAYGYDLVLTACILLFEEVSFHRYERMRDRLWLLLWMLLPLSPAHRALAPVRLLQVLARTDGLGRDGASRLCHCGKYPAAIIAGWREPVMRGQRLWSGENRRLWWVPWAVVVCCLGLTCDTLEDICMSAETDIVVLPQPLSPVVQEIEVVYIDGQAPRCG